MFTNLFPFSIYSFIFCFYSLPVFCLSFLDFICELPVSIFTLSIFMYTSSQNTFQDTSAFWEV